MVITLVVHLPHWLNQEASWSTLLFPLVALAFSAEYEGFVWQPHAIIGLAGISCANLLMFIRTPLRCRYRCT